MPIIHSMTEYGIPPPLRNQMINWLEIASSEK